MRKTLGVLALILALTCSAYAGNIPNMITDEPPPPPPPSNTTSDLDGWIGTGLTEAILSALEGALSLP